MSDTPKIDPEAWSEEDIAHNERLLEAIDAGRSKKQYDPKLVEEIRYGVQYRRDRHAGEADAIDLPWSTWRAANTPALPADAPLQPGEDPANAPMAKPAPAPAAPEPDIYEQYVAQPPAQPPAGSAVADFGRGAAQGATLGLADEGSSWLEAFLSPTTGERKATRDFDAPVMTPEQERAHVRESALRRERAANAQAEERSPWAYGGGQVAGALPLALATAPVAPAGAGLAVRAGQAALSGAALGTAAGYGTSEATTDAELLEDAASGGVTGGLYGAGGAVVGDLAGAGLKKTGEVIGKVADKAKRVGLRNRAAAVGEYGGEMAKMVKQRGSDLPERIGAAVERYGAHRRPESSLLPRFVPQSAGVYEETLGDALDVAGKGMSSAVDDATAAGAAVAPDDLAMALRDRQAQHMAKDVPDQNAIADGLDEIAGSLARARTGRGGAPYTPRELFDKRLDMKPTAKLDSNRNAMPEATHRAQAYREGRDIYKDKMLEAMGPEQAAKFSEANTDYGLLKMAHNAARNRQARELGNQLASINLPGSAAAGAVTGGIPGAVGVGAMIEGAKRVGRDVIADTMGATSRGLRVPAAAAQRAGQAVTSTGGPAGQLGAATASDDIFEEFLGQAGAAADDGGEMRVEIGEAQIRPSQSSLGEHPTAARARKALQGMPWALGDYAPQMQEALDAGPKEYGALLLRLQKDPRFMREVMPVIAAERGQENAR